jgi:predicted nucleic acid-binding protein
MKIFWDTNLFIYLWERRSYVIEIDALAAFMERGNHTLATSTLTMGEILVHPARSGRPDLVARYRETLHRLALLPFDAEAASTFAHLRAAHPALRSPDAIQLACAKVGACDLFLTNDNRLSALDIPSPLHIQSLQTWHTAHLAH